MPTTSDITETISSTVRRYLELVASGSDDDILDLFSPDARVEDPVGSEPLVGREAIRTLYTSLSALDRQTELLSLRVCGLEVAFQFAITFDAGDGRMRLEPIDTMTFDAEAKITSLRSYFSAGDVKQL